MPAIEICSPADVARELNARYAIAKQFHSKVNYMELLKGLFQSYGGMFGYNWNDFKKEITIIRLNLKNKKFQLQPQRYAVNYEPGFVFDEGDNINLTKDQIERFDLNPDSY